MGQHTLRRRLSYWIMIPLTVGTLITAAVSWIPIYIQYPSWIDRIVGEMITDQGMELKDLSLLSAVVGRELAQAPIDFLLLVRLFQEAYWAGEVPIKPDFIPSTNYQNGKLIALGQTIPVGYNSSTRLSLDSSMWYIDLVLTDEAMLGTQGKQQLLDCAVFDFVARPEVGYQGSSVLQMYHAFENDGLMYEMPAQNETYYLTYPGDPNCPYSSSEPHYDPRCRPWFKQVQSSHSPSLITLTDPYLFAGLKTLGQTVCRGKWAAETLEMVTCVDFVFDEGLFALFNLQNSTLMYTYALDVDGDVFFHPLLNRTDPNKQSIIDLELSGCPQSEKDYFSANILPLFSTGDHSFASYTKNSDKMWISVVPITLILNEYLETGFRLSVGVVMSESVLRQNFKDLISTSDNILQMELIVFFSALAVILTAGLLLSKSIASSIIKPIDDLAEILDRMNEGDLGVNIKMNFKQVPGEISKLYDVFSKLKIVLKFSRGNLSSGNDAEVLMNYAQAMKLFQEVRNVKGISVCSANIGNIHYKEGRFEEAIAYYQQAYNLAKEARDASSDQASQQANDRAVLQRLILLAAAFLSLSECTPKKQWDQAIELLSLIAREYETLNDPARRASALLDIAMAYIQWGHLEPAKEHVMAATTRILSAGDDWTLPPEILRERAMLTEGVILQKEGRHFEAASLFTSCIELNDHYDPVIRKHALKGLKEIFDAHSFPSTQISELLSEFETALRDIVIVLDYSSSMAGMRIHRVMSNLAKLFDRSFRDDDRVAFLTVNRISKAVFNLMEKGKNTSFLKAQMLKANEPKGGTASYDGIRSAMKQFDAFGERQGEESELLGVIEEKQDKRNKWIVAVFDGEDNCSQTSHKRLKKLLSSSSLNLVILGFFLPPDVQTVYKSLCSCTAKGLFLESDSLPELDTSFNAAARWIEAAAHTTTGSSLFQVREVAQL